MRAPGPMGEEHPAPGGQDQPSFGSLLRRLRLRARLTQEVLAERAGVSVATIGALEEDRRRRPYPNTIGALAEALGLSADERAALESAVPLRSEVVGLTEPARKALAQAGGYEVGEQVTSPGPAPAPAAHSSGAVVDEHRANLPAHLPQLIGRPEELEPARERPLQPDERLPTPTGVGAGGRTRCPGCHGDNPAGARFCTACGQPLDLACPGCRTANAAGSRFCRACGGALPTPPAGASPAEASSARGQLDGERKQATVLCCQIADATGLAERLGPEAMLTLMNRFLELALGEVQRYEGTVNALLGDGFTALFGVPLAHEDHARRAVLTALEVQRRLRERWAEAGPRSSGGGPFPVRVRVGLNTGLLAVGRVGDRPELRTAAVGDTPNVASYLQTFAEPDTILVSEATARLVTGYVRLEPIGPVPVQGRSEPVTAYKVVGLGPRRSPLEGLGSRPLTRFVGRDREMAALHDLLAQVAPDQAGQRALSRFVGREHDLAALHVPLAQVEAGRGQVVGIVGEPGMGKSRLIYEFRRSLGDKRVTYLEGRCLSYGGSIPYLPLLDIVRANCGIADGDSPEAVAEKVRFGLQEVGLVAEERTPYVLQLFGLKEGTEALAGLSPEAVRARTFEVLRQWSVKGGQRRPIVMALEDLHWVDATSEEYLASLVESLAGARILLLCTWRPGYRPPWSDHSYVSQLALRHLGPQDSLSIVQSVLQTDRVPAELARAIMQRAEGTPFFLEELARAVAEQGGLRAETVVPDTVQGVLMARIDRLPEAARRVLQTASVLGREFSLQLLEAIWDGPGPPGPQLVELRRQEFVYEQSAAGEPAYIFKHALTQDVAYESLLQARRTALHAAAGRALERLYAHRLEEVYERLAHHYAKTEEAAKAVEYLGRFAEKAARDYANADAARALEEALRHIERLPAEERDRRSVELALRLAHSLHFLGRLRDTLELLGHHEQRLERLGDPRLAGPYHFWFAHTYSYQSDNERAAASAQRALEAARRCGDEATMGKAHYVLSRTGFWTNQFLQGVEHGRRAVELLERTGEWLWLGQSYWALGLNYNFLGEFDAALEAESRVRAIGESTGDPRLKAYGDWSSGWVYATRGDWEEGIAACRRSLEHSPDEVNTSAALGWLGCAYLENGQPAEAIPCLEEASERWAQMGYWAVPGWYGAWVSEALRLEGQAERAREVALRSVDICRNARFLWGVAWAQRVLGRLALADGALQEAETSLAESRDTFAALQSRFELGRTHLALAELAHARRDQQGLAAHLDEARALFTALRAPRYVRRVEQLAEATRPVPAAEPDAAVPQQTP